MKEQRRLMVVNEVERGKVGGRVAGEVLGVSLRHLRRIVAAYRKDGACALAHGNRGRRPVNTIGDDVRERVVALASLKYAGFNQQHFTELLSEREGIHLCRSSVRNILLAAGIRSPKRRRPPRHRSRRDRYTLEGMLLQIDGSPHDWLEGRGPTMSLVGAIDDATGKVPYAVFREQEDTRGYFMLLEGIVRSHGIPRAVYHDRHSIFEITTDQREHETINEQLSGKPMLTQFGRLLVELGITAVSARSPQAKGRIERLWGTFQDRLVKEMRLAGISTMEEANRFLPDFLKRYNARFAVPAAEAGSAYASPEGLDLDKLFCLKYDRVVGADNVVRFSNQRLQILPSADRMSYARCNVEVHEDLSGALRVCYRGKYLVTRPAPPEAPRARKLALSGALAPTRPRPVTKPAPNHPWRRWVHR